MTIVRAGGKDDFVANDHVPERRLWTAVIVRAVQDWLWGPCRIQQTAQRFLFDDDKNFYHVCACAGLDAESFRSKLLRVKT